jgi:ribonucleoside-diphosphate reductase alpha chain
VGKLKSLNDLEELCDLAVRGLDELIDYQQYPIIAAEESTKNRRSLGIGYIGLAHYLAKQGEHYDDPAAWRLVHELTESFQYYLLKSSANLAKEKGKCGYFDRTKYSDGILPIDTYKKDLDEIVDNKLNHDWETLRTEIQTHGLRHSTLSAQMPSESSSVVSNETNGIEPPRDYLSVKKSKNFCITATTLI